MLGKVYTRTGDDGTTGLFGGKRIDKDDPRIFCYGDVDELNSWLGYIVSQSNHQDINLTLQQVQNQLFTLQASLSNPKLEGPQIQGSHIADLEKDCDKYNEQNTELNNFILPGGKNLGAILHIARTVCRRAERSCVSLSKKEEINRHNITYLNRLSDLLFILARLANKRDGFSETQPEY